LIKNRRFPEDWIERFEPLMEAMTKHPGARRVLAAAVRAHADLIVA
jgi:hypothetical protein